MDNPDNPGGQVTPEEAMRQLVQLRMQLGPARFATVARQMGMPAELMEHIEQSVTTISGEEAVPSRPSGLLDASGQPIGSTGGLVDASGRPLTSTPSLDGPGALNGSDSDLEEELEDGEDIELDEEASRQMFQELVGVRMIVGPENFGTLAGQMNMPAEAIEMVEAAAAQVETEITGRYDNQDEAMTVRLVNARMMMGPERFSDFAGQVGMPDEVIVEVESIAGQIEANGDVEEDGEDEEAEGPSLA